MTKFINYLNERKSQYGKGITMVDIDETIFNTFAKILVKDKDTGKVVRDLDNQEFNSYVLKSNEEYDFGQFRDAKFFLNTSIPIDKTVKRIQKMIDRIESMGKGSRIVFLTARADFDNKNDVINTFKKHGIKIKKPTTYIERAGNLKTGTIDEKKKKIILDYLKSGEYRRVRLLDDHIPNLKALLDIERNLPKEIENKVREKYNVPPEEEAIEFFALHVKSDGSLQRIN